jgi:dienelactone hydrolase
MQNRTKITLSTLLLLTACATQSKNPEQNKASNTTAIPSASFTEAGQTFEPKLILPKKFDKALSLVIVVHEWWGANDYAELRGQMLADEGYAALVVDLYGNHQQANTPDEAMKLAGPFYQNPDMGVSRLNQYLQKIATNPHIDPKQIFAIGYCFGGTQVLNWARSGVNLKGVVSFHGGLTTTLKTASELQPKILVLNGAADPMVPAKDIKAFKAEMKQAKAKLKFINYPNALHAFTNPKATEVGKQFKMPVAYNAAADAASWIELKKFLKQ